MYRHHRYYPNKKRQSKAFPLLVLVAILAGIMLYVLNTKDGRKYVENIAFLVTGSEKYKPSSTTTDNLNINAGDTYTYALYSEEVKFNEALPNFIKKNGKNLEIHPTSDNVGEYRLGLKAEDEKAIQFYNLIIKVSLAPVDFTALKQDVTNLLGTKVSKYSIYVYDLKRKDGFDINGEQVFYPASISKLPYAILTLKDVDAGKYSLSIVSADLTSLITHSDNAALMRLEKRLGGYATVNARIKSELGVDNIFRYPHTCQAVDIGELYKGIYKQSYLTKSSNDYLLNLLKHTDSAYNDRIQQGLPEGVEFAHKIGWVTTSGGEAYNDSGIVYGEVTDYIVVLLDKDVNHLDVIKMSKPISEAIYKVLN